MIIQSPIQLNGYNIPHCAIIVSVFIMSFFSLLHSKISSKEHSLGHPEKSKHKPNTSSPNTIDVKAAAAMCQYTYCKSDVNLVDGWREMTSEEINEDIEPGFSEKLVRNRSGFSSKLFKKKGQGFYYYAFCTEGTCMTSFKDWFSNISQGICGLSPQYTYSVQLAKILDKKIGEDHVLWFIGHSLGGGLASNNALICPNRHAITFDAAGLSFLRVYMTSLLNRPSNLLHPIKRSERIHAFVLRNEALNLILTPLFQRAYGRKKIVEIERHKDIFESKYFKRIQDEIGASFGRHDLIRLIEEIDDDETNRIRVRYYQIKTEDYTKE